NAYFAETMSVISLPDQGAALRTAVDEVCEDFLQYVDGADDLPRERKRAKVDAALHGLRDAEVWAEIQRRRSGAQVNLKPIKQDELHFLMKSAETLGEDVPDGDFYAHTL